MNVLIDLYNFGRETKLTFYFVNQTIQPEQAKSKESKQLMNDYVDWLPNYFGKHNCDLIKLEKLETTFWTDSDKTLSSTSMNNALKLTVNAVTILKADGREEQTIAISQTELKKKSFLS